LQVAPGNAPVGYINIIYKAPEELPHNKNITLGYPNDTFFKNISLAIQAPVPF
jgi:ABC-type Fe3+ transport system substrate-binding protein